MTSRTLHHARSLAMCLMLAATVAAPVRGLSLDGGHLNKDSLFAGADQFAKGATEATEVNLDKSMLGLLKGFDGSADQELSSMANKLDFVYVRSYQYPRPGMYQTSELKNFRKRLKGDDWSHVVGDRTATEQTDVWMRTDKEGQFSELVVIDAEPKELDLVHLKGHMSMRDLTRAGAKYGVPPIPDPQLKMRSK